MRTIGLTLIVVFTCWAAVQAQVAAPNLNPLQLNPTSAWNPAVLSWDGPSRIGGSYVDASMDFSTTGFSLDDAIVGDGNALHLRLIGESLAFGADYWVVNMEIDQTLGGGDAEFGNTTVGVSFQIGETFSIGGGQESGDAKFGTDFSADTLPIVGATLRLGGTFYLGFATGTETTEEEDTSIPGSFGEGDRTVTRFGVAYQMRDGANGLHVEVWREEGDAINTAALTVGSEESTGVTVEVVFANILIGFESISIEEVDPATGSVDGEENITNIAIGWVPMEGLQIVASLLESEKIDITNNQILTFNILSAGVAWSF